MRRSDDIDGDSEATTMTRMTRSQQRQEQRQEQNGEREPGGDRGAVTRKRTRLHSRSVRFRDDPIKDLIEISSSSSSSEDEDGSYRPRMKTARNVRTTSCTGQSATTTGTFRNLGSKDEMTENQQQPQAQPHQSPEMIMLIDDHSEDHQGQDEDGDVEILDVSPPNLRC